MAGEERRAPKSPVAPYPGVNASRSRPPSPCKSGARGLTERVEITMAAQPLLDINDLTVEFATRRGIVM